MYKCIVMEPELEGNLGFLARVMANFDFRQLILVNPKVKIGKEAKDRAVHAQEILENVRITDTLDEALEMTDFAVGSTGLEAESSSNVLRNCMTAEEMGERAGKVDGDVAVVLGRESKGLSNEELEKCDMVAKVPTSDDYPVMNITHAAGALFYEVFKHSGEKSGKASSRGEKEFLKNIFKNMLTELDYSEEETERAMRCLSNFIGRSFLEKKEANTLIGLFKRIESNLGD